MTKVMRYAVGVATAAMLCAGCATNTLMRPAESVDEYLAAVRQCEWIHLEAIAHLEATCKALEVNFPIRIGMSVEQVQAVVSNENAAAETDSRRYGFLPINAPPGAMTFILGNPNWIWVDLAIQGGRVQNIFMTGGNGEILVPPGFRFAGEGRHVGGWAEAVKEMGKE